MTPRLVAAAALDTGEPAEVGGRRVTDLPGSCRVIAHYSVLPFDEFPAHVESVLADELWMVARDPIVDTLSEPSCLPRQLPGLTLGCRTGQVVVDDVPLAAAGVEVSGRFLLPGPIARESASKLVR